MRRRLLWHSNKLVEKNLIESPSLIQRAGGINSTSSSNGLLRQMVFSRKKYSLSSNGKRKKTVFCPSSLGSTFNGSQFIHKTLCKGLGLIGGAGLGINPDDWFGIGLA